MDYETLNKEDFDAVVTGEMTHYALWNEKWLDSLIAVYFISDITKQNDFRRLILERDGLGAQDKIEIIQAMIPLFNIPEKEIVRFKNIIKQIVDFKSWRNALAHGVDVTEGPFNGKLSVEVITRSGREKTIDITPQSHNNKTREADELLAEMKDFKKNVLHIRELA